MTVVRVDTREVRGLAASLGRASAETAERAALAVRKTAFDIERDAKALAPVDTGYLRSSISTSITRGGLSAEVGPTAEYGGYVEYGTSRMGPQPYMGPALDRNEPGFTAAVAELLAGLL